MATNHTTARGTQLNMDRLLLANEKTIAVGNMKVNARGDQLGPGGKIIKTRNEIMAERNRLHNGPLAQDDNHIPDTSENPQMFHNNELTADDMMSDADFDMPRDSNTTDTEPAAEQPQGYVKPRGSFAESIAQQTQVDQELLDPSTVIPTAATGIRRL
jgi:hypothetical protein